ncbi:hypothetical protein N9073_06475, partial [Akkermansiaceae bacterium]|nr:hypothetical protein [Akkermansiaceae bacterium]
RNYPSTTQGSKLFKNGYLALATGCRRTMTIKLFLIGKLLRINTLEGNPQVGLKLFQPSLKSSLVARTI